MYTQNGELVTISRTRPAFKNKYLGSMQFRILCAFIVVGILPFVLYQHILLSNYEQKLADNRLEEIKSQCNVLADQLVKYSYMDGDGSESIDAQITMLSAIFDGRVIVIDDEFKVISDNYSMENGKYIVSEEVVKAFKGDTITNYDTVNKYMEMAMPITNSETKEIVGILLVSFSSDSIVAQVNELQRNSLILAIAFATLVILFAAVYSKILVVPFDKIASYIDRITEGYLDEEIAVNGYTETKMISDAFNKMMKNNQALEQSRQEFVSNVSHELKTPITSIKVLADSLIMQEDVPVELYKEFLTDIADEIDRESKIINDLLSLVKMDKTAATLNISSVNINELLELILKRLRPIAAKRNIELVFESFRPVMAEIDEVKLTLAITNLVENAIKYNVEDGWVRVSLNADHKYFYVKVADSGIGIPEDSQDKVFERFYRVDKARSRETGGTGLGLSITRNAILMHRGAIKLYSKEDEGTTFTVRVPLTYIA